MSDCHIISFYKFVNIEHLQPLREKLLKILLELDIKGTIILASEGINGMLAGQEDNIIHFEDFLKKIQSFSDIEFKKNKYAGVAFKRSLVKIKKEIITLRRNVDPTQETGEYVSALDFKKWLDHKKKDLILLDTRNDYEVAMGSFENAINPNIKSFEEFALYIDKHADSLKDKEIVTYCTGGIRCEKATAYMKQKGIHKAYQLEGGIIKYFQQTKNCEGSNHWVGECTVFDRRKAITSKLQASNKIICYVCLQEIIETLDSQEKNKDNELCNSCHLKMTKYKQLRQQKGLLKAKQNYKNRITKLKIIKENLSK